MDGSEFNLSSKFRNLWSVIISIALVCVLGVSPHAAYADTANDSAIIAENDNEDTSVNGTVVEQPADQNSSEQGILPLVLAPVAAYGITSTVVSSIFTVGLGWYVGSSDLFKNTVYDKQDTSSAQYGIQNTPYSYDYFPDFAGFLIETSATKHMEETLVKATADRIKNYGRFGNLRVFGSTRRPANVMAVIDITSPMGGTVNRHLGNYLSGKIGPYSNTAYKNEWMDLAG